MANQTSILTTSHDSLITHLAFNLHGTRLATSSLDHTVRVVSLNRSSGLWDASPSDFKAHDAPVLKVVWGHPEFGTLLASGGVDGVVKVWTEEEVRGAGNQPGGKKWVQRVALTDARGTIRDLEFGPPEFGLKLAVVSSDSHLRLWECLNPISLADWSLIEDIDLSLLPVGPTNAMERGGSTSGSAPTAGAAKGFGEAASPSKLGAPGTSLTSSSAGSASSEGRKGGAVESDGGWALSWCKEAWWGERIAVAAGTSGIIRLFHLPDHAPWSNYLNLLPPRPTSSFSPQPPPTSSLSWSPASGRSYQLLASGSRDGRARVWKVHTPSLEEGAGEEEWRGEMDAELDEGNGRNGSVGGVKVDWNVTGTVLSTAQEDAKVRLWKSTYTGRWQQIAVLSTEDKGQDEMSLDK